MIQEVLSSLGWGKDEGWIEEQDLSPDSHLSWLPALDESSSSSSSCSPSSSSSSSSSFSHGNDCLNGGGWVDAKVGVDDGSYSSSLIFGVSDQVVQIFLVFLVCLPFLFLFFYFLFRRRAQYIREEFQNIVSLVRQNRQIEHQQRNPDQELDTCPICLGVCDIAVVTNCNHTFCAGCILDFWEMTNRGRLPCPICRRNVNLLQPLVFEDELDSPLIERVDFFNRNSSGNLTFFDRIRDTPALLRVIWRNITVNLIVRMFGTLRVILFFIFSVLYLFSPFDLIPESVFGILGLLDDLIVFIVVLVVIANCFRTVLLSVRGRGRRIR